MPDIQARFKELLIQIASGFYHVDLHWVSPMWILTLLTCTLDVLDSRVGWIEQFLHFRLHLLRKIRGLPLPILPKRGRALHVDFFYLEGLLAEGGVHSQEERRLTSYTKSKSFLFVVTYFMRVLFLSSLYNSSCWHVLMAVFRPILLVWCFGFKTLYYA